MSSQAEASSVEAEHKFEWTVRRMQHADIPKCLEIWLRVELTEAHQMVASALATDPAGFWVAEMDGKVVGMCTGCMARPDTAFMGFYAVEPSHQGRGIGRELWAKTMERMGANTNIGLYGVPTMSDKYKKAGFSLEDSVRMLIYESQLKLSENGQQRHEIHPNRLHDLGAHKISPLNNGKWLLISSNPLDSVNGDMRSSVDGFMAESEYVDENIIFDELVEYDERVNMNSRRELLKNYLLGEDVPLTVMMLMRADEKIDGVRLELVENTSTTKSADCRRRTDVADDAMLSHEIHNSLTISATDEAARPPHDRAKSDLQVVGYGCVRYDNTGGAMIGPLYADCQNYCEIILGQLLQNSPLSPGGKYSAMTLTSNPRASEILERIGFRQMDQCSRMFTKFVPKASLSQVYLIHSPNFTLF